MKITLNLKDPDGVYQGIEDALSTDPVLSSLPEDEREALADVRREKLQTAIEPWVEYNEYVTVEIDTDLKTAVVLQKKN